MLMSWANTSHNRMAHTVTHTMRIGRITLTSPGNLTPLPMCPLVPNNSLVPHLNHIHHHPLLLLSCYVISHFHTPKISSLGLMIKHEQFHLNHSTKHIFSQKLFCEHCFGNSKTLGYCSYQNTNYRFTL